MSRVFLLADTLDSWPASVVAPGHFARSREFLRPTRVVANFRQLSRSIQPQVLHADGPAALRAAFVYFRLRGPGRSIALVASGVQNGWLVRQALRRADRVLARSLAEQREYAGMGVPAERIVLIPHGVPPASPGLDGIAFRRELTIPTGARLIVAAGRFDTEAALRSAVWSFDILKYVVPDCYLVLVGDGPERSRVEQFARAIGFDDYRTRFAGPHTDLTGIFALAEVAWIPHERGGIALALAAMRAGRPIVASRTPELAEVVEDGVTGRLVPPRDRPAFAAVTLELLRDPATARQLGEAGQRRANGGFSEAQMAGRLIHVYDELAGSTR